MQYAKFRDWFFDVLFKITPAEERLGMFPIINKIEYWMDKIAIYFLLFVCLPALFLGNLYVAWLHIKMFF